MYLWLGELQRMSQFDQSQCYCIATAWNGENVELIESELSLWTKSQKELCTLNPNADLSQELHLLSPHCLFTV